MRVYRQVCCAVLLLALVLAGCSKPSAESAVVDFDTATAALHEIRIHRDSRRVAEYLAEMAKNESDDYRTPLATDAWYNTGRLIYHACGAIDGVSYTNSREALEGTLAAGHRLVEVDFRFTLDGHLVCVHEWYDLTGISKCCNLDVFLSKKIMDQYTPMTATDIIGYMTQYPDLYIIVDTKEYGLNSVVAELVSLCDGDPAIVERMIIQCYTRGDKAKILAVYPFPDDNFLFSVYKFGSNKVNSILEICRDEDISIVAVHNGRWGEATMARFLEAGCIVFEHTVNDVSLLEPSLKKGVHGFYTDSLQPEQIPKAHLTKEVLNLR